METIKKRDPIIEELLQKVKIKAQMADIYGLLLPVFEGIFSINQLKELVFDKGKLKNLIRRKNIYLGIEDEQLLDGEVLGFLTDFINENNINKHINIVSPAPELSDETFFRMSGLEGSDISEEVTYALKNTASDNQGTVLAIQKPFACRNDFLDNILGNMSVMDLMRLLASKNNNVEAVLEDLGIKKIVHDKPSILFKMLFRSLTPSIIEFNGVMLRGAIVDGPCDNLYGRDNDSNLKKRVIAAQLVTIANYFINNANNDYTFGLIDKQDVNKLGELKRRIAQGCLMDFPVGSVEQHFLDMCYSRFTFRDIENGIESFSFDNPFVTENCLVRKKTTLNTLFVPHKK